MQSPRYIWVYDKSNFLTTTLTPKPPKGGFNSQQRMY